ncbi:MAG: hypothetical protein FD152_378 [Xanthobacteraceae bacterium]|nr:MAG: hypothetical protein FD152_378 [Xanthobacteraceae bacterium]
MVPQRQEPIVPLMLGTPPASRAGSWFKTSVFGDGSFRAPRHRGMRFKWSMRGQLFGRPLTHFQGSGGQVRAPCSLAVIGTDEFKTGIAITFPRDAEISRSDELSQMQQFGVAAEVQEHAQLCTLSGRALPKVAGNGGPVAGRSCPRKGSPSCRCTRACHQ